MAVDAGFGIVGKIGKCIRDIKQIQCEPGHYPKQHRNCRPPLMRRDKPMKESFHDPGLLRRLNFKEAIKIMRLFSFEK
jgi:hypothetical protein